MDRNLETICTAPDHGLPIYQVSAWSDLKCRRSYPETKSLQTERRMDAEGHNIQYSLGVFFINPPVPVGRGIGWEGLKFNGPPRDRLCRWIHRVSAVKIMRRNLNNTGKFLWPLDVSDLIRRKIPVLPRWGGKGVYKVGVAKIKGNISFCTQL